MNDRHTLEQVAWRVGARLVVLTFAILLLGWLVVQLRSVVIQVLLAVILAAGMTPLVDGLTASPRVRAWRWRPPRALVVLALYLLLVFAILLLGALVVPPLLHQVEELVRGLPHYAEVLQSQLAALQLTYNILPGVDINETLNQQLRALLSQVSGLLSQALLVVRFALSFFSGALNGVFILILALYITADSRRILGYILYFFPADRRLQAERIAQNMGIRLGGWVRGQILLSGIIGLITLIGLSAIGVRYSVLLAVIAGIGEAIPMVGPIFSAIPAVILAFFQSPVQGFLTLALYILIQQFENHLIVPKVMERAVSLHPIAVLLALLAGSELLGVAGAILAVPVTAAVAVVVDEIRRSRASAEPLPPPVEPADTDLKAAG
jgi:predicted PurR-regulated permease PerM